MRCETVYSVGGRDRTFSSDEWDKLAAALPALCTAWDPPAPYRPNLKSPKDEYRTFCVSRADHKPLIKKELEYLLIFFRGVMAAHGMTLQTW